MLSPRDEADLAGLIAGRTEPVSVRGGGTRGIAPDAGEALSVSALSGITLYEPGALTIVARAGTPLSEIEEALAKERQMLAFEPMDHRKMLGTEGEPTIGGVVAGNVSGPRRVQCGACRDFLLGVRFVDGSGTIVKNGGRVMKNVTGYDLVKLMAGSHGTLGVLTEVSLKVLPMPDAEATLTLHGLDPAEAIAAMSKALTTPFDVSGAYHGEETRIRVEGMEESVSYRAGKLKGVLSAWGEVTVDRDEASKTIWSDVRHMTALADAPFVARSAVTPSTAPEIVESAPDMSHCLDWGGGRIWHFGTASVDRARALREAVGRAGGHMTVVKGEIEGMPRFHPENPILAKLASELRQRFDPKAILNPGVMG